LISTQALNRRSNEDHSQVLILAAMIYQVMSLAMVSLMRNLIAAKRMSYEKLFDNFSDWIIGSQNLMELWDFDPDPRHITMESRQDRKPLKTRGSSS